jgi:hypothetical protein
MGFGAAVVCADWVALASLWDAPTLTHKRKKLKKLFDLNSNPVMENLSSSFSLECQPFGLLH